MTENPSHLDPLRLLEEAGWIRSLARQLVFAKDGGDDLAQDTFVTALEKRPRLRGSLRAWLASVMKNKEISRYRREMRRVERERHSARGEELPSPDEVMERAELHRRMVEEVFALREPFRTTVLLRFFEGLEYEQIAAQQQIPEATVRSRMKRALDELRERLDERFGNRRQWCLALAGLAALDPRTTLLLSSLGSATAASTTASATTAGTAAAGSTIGASTLTGGLIMSGKTIALVLGITAAVCGGTIYFVTKGQDEAPGTAANSGKGAPAAITAKSESTPRTAPAPETGAPKGVASPTSTAQATATIAVIPIPAEPGTSKIQGSVQDEQGNPIQGAVLHAMRNEGEKLVANAQIFLDQRLGSSIPPIESQENRAVSAANGAFQIAGLAPGNYSLVARAEGRRQKLVREIHVTPAEPAEIFVKLGEGKTIDGIVLDPMGKPAAGAEVQASAGLFHFGSAGEGISFTVGTEENGEESGPIVALSDARGQFKLQGLPAGKVELSASHADWSRSRAEEVSAGERGVTLRLQRGATVTGTVVTKDGEAVAGAAVQVAPGFNFSSLPSSATDAEGRFTLERVPAGMVSLLVNAPGLPPRFQKPFEVKDGEVTAGVTILLDRGVTLTGTVTDPSGQPLANAQVKFGSANMPFENWQYIGQTNPKGEFIVTGIRDGDRLKGLALHSAHAERAIDQFVATGPTLDLGVIALAHAASISGIVLDENGAPIAGASVKRAGPQTARMFGGAGVQISLGEQSETDSQIEVATAEAGGGGEGALTAEDGSYRLEPLSAGELRLEVQRAGYQTLTSEPISIAEGETQQGVDFHLLAALRITGVVVDEAQSPIAGATVHVGDWVNPEGPSPARSDETGAFELVNLNAGQYTVNAKADGYAQATLQEVAAGSVVTLVLKPQGSIAGVVRDLATSSPIGSFRARAEKTNGDGVGFTFSFGGGFGQGGGGELFNDPQGRFTLTGLDPGTYTVHVSADGHVAHAEQNVEVRSAAETGVEIALDTGGAIEGIVVNHRGERVAGARVRFVKSGGEDGEAAKEVVTRAVGIMIMEGSEGSVTSFEMGDGGPDAVESDEQGKFVLSGLSEQKGVLQIEHTQYMTKKSEEFEIARGRTLDAGRVELARGGSVFGHVDAPAGAGFGIFLTNVPTEGGANVGDDFQIVPADPKGDYRKTGLKPGRYKLAVRRFGDGMLNFGEGEAPNPNSVEFTVSGEEELRRDFRLEDQ